MYPASAAIEKRDAAFAERGLGEKARAFHIDLPIVAVRKLGLPVDGGDVEDTLDPGNRSAQTRRVRQLAFETLDIEAFEERQIARGSDEGTNLVAGLSEQARQVASCEPVGTGDENFQSSLLPALWVANGWISPSIL